MGKEKKIEDFQNGAILNNRSCTDCPMILFWLLFMAGWFAVAVVAIIRGNPYYILLPENFDGHLCGREGTYLQKYPFSFAPLPSRPSYTICVSKCPALNAIVCNNRNRTVGGVASPNHLLSLTAAEVTAGRAGVSCGSGCTTAQQAARTRLETALTRAVNNDCFPVYYSTQDILFRCLPSIIQDNAVLTRAGTTLDTVNGLINRLGIGHYFTQGFAETEQCLRVLAVCLGTAFVLSALWIWLMRCMLAPLVYLTLFLILVLLVCAGFVGRYFANNLATVQLPGEQSTTRQQTTWQVIQYGSWVLAGIYFVAMLWLLKRIRIAVEIIHEGGRAFASNWFLAFVPLVTFLMAGAVIVFSFVLMLYIQTMGGLTVSQFTETARPTAAINAITDAGLVPANFVSTAASVSVSVNHWQTTDITRPLHAYNLFGLLWLANAVICMGFFIQAFVVVVWYFSVPTCDQAQEGKECSKPTTKYTPMGTFCSVVCKSLSKHLGTVLFGSLLIAIIQFIRAVFLYIQENYLSKWKEQQLMAVLLYCINCCLACIERTIKIISKNAFVMTCCSNKSFCPSAFKVIALLLSNGARFGIITFISSVIFLLLKLCIVASNVGIAWILIRYVPLLTRNQPVDSGLFPLIAVFIFTYIVASLFVSLFESCTDAVFMCVLYDEKKLGGLFLPVDLSKLLDCFEKVEKARQEYERRIEFGSTALPEAVTSPKK